jgi:uncharacterized Fe-S radical SAM superfamily protein PflX
MAWCCVKDKPTIKLLGRWVAMLVMAGTVGASAAGAHDGKKHSRVPMPTMKIEKGDKCVEPTEVMRRDHMEFILHQRDETMHRGIRTTKHSLKECINCHANPKTNSVLGKEGFCQSCHAYSAVTMDCFGCHSSSPEKMAQGDKR